MDYSANLCECSRASLPNFYIFKEVKNTKNYISLWVAKKGWMDTYSFSCWMNHFTFLKEKEGILSPSMRHLIILDGNKFHISLEALASDSKKKRCGHA